MIYLIVVLCVAALLPMRNVQTLSGYSVARKNKLSISKRNASIFLGFLVVFVFSSIRYGIGTDYFFTYVPGFIVLRNGVYSYTYYEPAFLLLNRICIAISNNYQVLFAATSLITYGLLFAIIKYYSKFPRYSWLVYFGSSMYFNSLSNIRQGIAMMICLLGLEIYVFLSEQVRNATSNLSRLQRRLTKQRIIVYLAFVVLASLFHTSTVVMTVIPILGLIKRVRFKNYIYIVLITIACAVIMNYSGIIQRILHIALRFIERYQRYNPSNSIYWSFLLLNTIILFFMYFIASQKSGNEANSERSLFYFNVQFAAVLVLLFSNVIPWSDRLSRYFMMTQVISVPHFLGLIRKGKNRNIYSAAIITLYLAWILFYIFSYGADGCFPYATIFGVDSLYEKGFFGF